MRLWDSLLLRPPQFALFIGASSFAAERISAAPCVLKSVCEVCLVHFFRLSLLALEDMPPFCGEIEVDKQDNSRYGTTGSVLSPEEASHVANFLASCAQLVDCQVLVSSALALFQALCSILQLLRRVTSCYRDTQCNNLSLSLQGHARLCHPAGVSTAFCR